MQIFNEYLQDKQAHSSTTRGQWHNWNNFPSTLVTAPHCPSSLSVWIPLLSYCHWVSSLFIHSGLTGSRTGTWRYRNSPSWKTDKSHTNSFSVNVTSQIPVNNVLTDVHTHLDMAQMKSIDTAHLYFGASSWSSWLTWVNSCKVTREEI